MNDYLKLHYKASYLGKKTKEELQDLYTKHKLIDALKTLGIYKDYMKRLKTTQLQKKYDQALTENFGGPKSTKINVKDAQVICDNLFLSIMKD